MLDGYFRAYYDARQQRQNRYDAALSSGSIDPFVYPHETTSILVLLFAIFFIPLLPITKRAKKITSISAFVVIFSLCASTVYRCRTIAFAGGYGIGLMCSWGIIASGYLLVFNDPGTSFQRLERRNLKVQNGTATKNSLQSDGSVAPATNCDNRSESSGLSKRIWGVNGPVLAPAGEKQEHQSQPQYVLVWQGFPESTLHRLDWAIDLVTSFRGVHWNWRISSLSKHEIPLKDSSNPASRMMWASPPSAMQALRRQAIHDFIVQYLFLDLVKTVTITDPYFHGSATLSSPSPWPFLTDSATLTYLVRLLISLAGVLSALTFIFSLSPLLFPLLPPSVTLAPLHEPALYPPYWGPFCASVLDKGLPGFWGKWWHQMFRFGISEPSRYLISTFGLQSRSPSARIISVLTAFALSGSIHAIGSYTSFLSSRPLSGPFAFFMLQGLGVLAQSTFLKLVSANICETHRLPSWLRRLGNGLFVLTWLLLTGPLLANDFARCGVWLFEPLPVSLFRGLLGQGWWCWLGQRVMWWTGRGGENWWRKGIAVI
jgi:hypothetical protein